MRMSLQDPVASRLLVVILYLLSLGAFLLPAVGAADTPVELEGGPSLRVLSTTGTKDAPPNVTIEVRGSNRSFRECVASGLDLSYRFRARVCRRRSGWFARCSDVVEESAELQVNLVSGTARIIRDRIGDRVLASTSFVGSEEAGLEAVRISDPIPINAIVGADSSLLNSRNAFLDVRVNVVCKGEGELLRELAEDITLGIFELKGFDSGWQEFALP